jgi:hypothetical protein
VGGLHVGEQRAQRRARSAHDPWGQHFAADKDVYWYALSRHCGTVLDMPSLKGFEMDADARSRFLQQACVLDLKGMK